MDPTVAFRWLPLAGVLGTFAISVYFRYQARRTGHVIRRGEEPLALKLFRLVVALPLLGSVVVVFARPQWLAWASLPLPEWVRIAGTTLTLAAVPAAWWVFRSIGRNVSETVLTKADHELVTAGPYRWIRHPLYTTGTMLLVGAGLATSNGFVLAFAVLAGLLIAVYVIPMEERELQARFGDAYLRYVTRTGGMLPRPFGR